MISIFLILALLIAVVAVIFALQNTTQVTIAFLMWQFDQSLALVLLLALAIGVIIGLLAISPTVVKSKLALSNHKKKIDSLEKEINQCQQKIVTLEAAQQPAEIKEPENKNS